MTILTILLFISCILFLIGYRKERSRRIALEKEVKSFADRKAYDINQLLDGSSKALSDNRSEDIKGQIYEKECAKAFSRIRDILEKDAENAKPKAMTAPIVKKNADGYCEYTGEVFYKDNSAPLPQAKQQEPKVFAWGPVTTEAGISPEKITVTNKYPLPKIPRGYKRHDGGKCPFRQKDVFNIIRRDGSIVRNCRLSDDTTWIWTHSGVSYDIIAYKVVKPKTMKRGKR